MSSEATEYDPASRVSERTCSFAFMRTALVLGDVWVIGLVCSVVYSSIHVYQFVVKHHNAAHSPHLSHTSLSPFSPARTLGFVLFCTDRLTVHEFHLEEGTARRSRDKIRNSSIM